MLGSKLGIYNSQVATPFAFGNALKPNGGTAFVSFPTITQFNTASSASIHFWLKSATTEIGAVGYSLNSTNRFGVLKFSDDNIYVYCNNGIGNVSFASYLGAATLVSVVFDGSLTGNANRLKLYLNGVQQTLSFSGTVPTTTNSTTGTDFELNTYRLTSSFGNSKYDEISLVNGATSGTEITNLYNSGNGAFANSVLSNLIAYYRCNESDGASSLATEVGSYTGTLNNFSTPPAYFTTW